MESIIGESGVDLDDEPMSPLQSLQDENFCLVCTKNFKNARSYKTHLRKYHGKGKIHECILCDTSYTVLNDLIAHIQEHRRQMKKYFACHICDVAFDEGRSLENHVVSHIGPEIVNSCKKNLHDCSECGAAFPSIVDLCTHRKKKHVDQKYQCGQCEAKFSRSEDLHLHTRLHRGLCLLKCLCGKMFANARYLGGHIRKMHAGLVDESVLVMLSEGLPIDFKNIRDWSELQPSAGPPPLVPLTNKKDENRFVVAKTNEPDAIPKIFERKFKCPVKSCPLVFVKLTTVSVHCSRNHPGQVLPSDIKKIEEEANVPDLALIPFRYKENPIVRATCCNICDTEFPSRVRLLEHLKDTHDANRPFKCSHCKLLFSKVRTLQDHIDLIHETDKFRCDYCGILFQKQTSLTAHYKKHEGDETFTCATCQVPYTNRKQLQKHMRIHWDGLPHKCDYCDKRFAQSCDKTKHERKHTGVKPFKCKTCNRAFSQPTSLKKHEMIHTNAREFVCTECGKAFQYKTNLTVHMRIHNGE